MPLRPLPWVAAAADRWPAPLLALAGPLACVPVPADVLSYLAADGLLLPRPAGALRRCDPRTGDDFDELSPGPFVEFEAAIEAAIDRMGEVFPKMNYSAPVDAKWMTGTLKCRSAGDVYVLLKASDFVQHDLERTMGPCLVLKKWRDIDPRNEFRLFVVAGKTVAACQRDAGNFFPHLQSEATRAQLWKRLSDFCNQRIVPVFDSQGGDYCVDVCLNSGTFVFLIDVGPIFDTNLVPISVLTGEESVLVPLFVIQSQKAVDRSADRALAMHRVPLEIVTGDLRSMDEALLRLQSET